MKIYTANITPRLRYILDLLLHDMLGIDYILTTDIYLNNNDAEPFINYSCHNIKGSFMITPSGLLFEKEIIQNDPGKTGHWDGCPVFYETSGGDIPFDIFAASFFLVTRYEEYLPFIPDSHGRFPSSLSYARKQNFLHLPVVNIWVHKLGEKLKKHFPGLIVKTPDFSFLSTIDIDNVWEYHHRPFLHNTLSLLKSILKGDLRTFQIKKDIVIGKQRDPFDTYDEWEELHRGIMEKVYIFILAGAGSRKDNLINPGKKEWQEKIRELSGKYPPGLHPSYRANLDERIITREKNLLESVIGTPVTRSRQHFLRLSMPDTYRALIKSGIKEDYTMGFHDHTGFRAGIAYPFPFFDLISNESTELVVYPLVLMDRTLKDYMGLSPSYAMEETEQLIKRVKSTGGLFISLWHNSSLGDTGEWKEWRKVYMQMNEICKQAVK